MIFRNYIRNTGNTIENKGISVVFLQQNCCILAQRLAIPTNTCIIAFVELIKDKKMMTDFESNCYGMSEQQIRDQYMNSITAKFSGLEMVAMGIMSDCQEMLAMGAGPRSVEYVRKQLNVAKFILGEMMEAKREAA